MNPTAPPDPRQPPPPDRNGSGALAAALHAALPQTQCTRCGYPDCAAYAQAIAREGAPINQCPPGGAEGVARLAALTGQPVAPLNPDHGPEAPRQMAVIDEDWCIGCTLCLKACPVDAIVGGPKLMHTIIEAHCTGCELCVPVCPVDCIALENTTGTRTGWAAWSAGQAQQALSRYTFHQDRERQWQADQDDRLAAKAQVPHLPPAEPSQQPMGPVPADAKRAAIEAALARARAARQPKA